MTEPNLSLRRLILIAIATLIITGNGAATPAAEKSDWQNALAPAGQAAPPLTLVANAAPAYAILLPAAPTAVERTAATDLQHWLNELTGTKFSLATEDQPPAGISRFISIGGTTLQKQSKSDGADLGDEGYEIAVAGENLLLRGGHTRGIVNAVYAVLEEDIGCRWYTRAGDVRLPTTRLTTLNVVPRRYVPKLKLRDPYYHAAFDAEWSCRNRTNAPGAAVPADSGGHVDYGGLFVHTQTCCRRARTSRTTPNTSPKTPPGSATPPSFARRTPTSRAS
jgi:hypothetical protein